MVVDYKPDLSGVGVYLQVLVPRLRGAMGGDQQYEEVWRAFPKELATRTRPMIKGDLVSYADEFIDEWIEGVDRVERIEGVENV